MSTEAEGEAENRVADKDRASKPEGFANAFEELTPSTSLGSPKAMEIREANLW
jgi:hypothetical protein